MRRVSRCEPCPICGRDDWCSVGPGFAICVCVADGATKTSANGGYVHRLDGPRRAPPSVQLTPGQLAPRHIRHRVYDALLAELGLSEVHLEALLPRGFTDDAAAGTGPWRQASHRRGGSLPGGCSSRPEWSCPECLGSISGRAGWDFFGAWPGLRVC